ncbi:MAG: hypothetical protein HYR73_07815 [Candidatus Eisenbacteria bacterium]|nr:hypothetical protein [Candidatus Eisenbacteria bacterium]
MSAAELDAISSPDAESWWAEPGLPGWTPDSQLGSAFAWTLAGHSVAGWSRAFEAAAPLDLPWPSTSEARRPLVWADSISAGWSANAGWLGPDATLAAFHGVNEPTRGVRARSVFRTESGDFGVTRYSLAFERGDSSRWVRYEVGTGNHGDFGAVGNGGDHVWSIATRLTHGSHVFEGSLGQRGAALELAGVDVSNHSSGQSGSLKWRWSQGGRQASLAFRRGLDHRESIIDVEGIPVSFSRREASENRLEADVISPLAGGTAGARATYSAARVARYYDNAFDVREHLVWGAASFERRAGDGTLRLELGGGHSSALDRNLIAPSVSFAFGAGGATGRVIAERVVHPVWSDLALLPPSFLERQAPFLQRTTALGFEARGGSSALSAEGAVLAGTTRDRAIVFPYPIEDVWLQAGAAADPRRYDFVLATAGVRASRGGLAAGASGFALGRDQDASEPKVEPGMGARGWMETSFRLFQGDLGVRLRGDVAGVGPRESKTGGIETRIEGYWTSSGRATLTLADVTVILNFRNLENQRRPQSWIDPATGDLALGPGREFRFALTWRMFN